VERIRPLLPPIGIFALAFLVCAIYNLTVSLHYTPQYDSLAYQSLAFHMLDEHCFCYQPHVTTLTKGPFWPFVIAGLSLVFGRANLVDRLFLSAADAGTCVLIYYLARDLFGKRAGLVAGLVACVYPALYIYTGWMYSETLYTFLQTAIIYTVLRIQRSQGRIWWLWVLCGVLLGCLSLTHPNGLLVIGLLVLWVLVLVWRQGLPRAALVHLGLAVVVACAVIAPWTIRNYNVSKSFVPVSGDSGTVLLGAYNNMALTDRKYPGGWIAPITSDPQVALPYAVHPCAATCEVARGSAETAAAIQWIKGHLADLPLLLVDHLRNFFTPYTSEADMPLTRFTSQRSTRIVLKMSETIPYAIFLAAALGLVVTLRRYWRELLFAYLVILGTVAGIVVFYGNSRFRSPIEPLLLLLGAGALWWLTESQPGTLHYWMRHRELMREPQESHVLS
jgi:4-amino-4-deoxy-L-arabinose transferase-like glycosyltransferase